MVTSTGAATRVEAVADTVAGAAHGTPEAGAAGGRTSGAPSARTPASGPPSPAAAPHRPRGRDRVTETTRRLRFDGGCLALDLVATLGRRPGGAPVERLADLDRLRAWCEGVGLPVRDEELTEALLSALRLLREAAYDVVVTDLRGSAPALTSVALVNECAHHAPPPPRLETGPRHGRGGVGVERAELTGRQVCSLVARDLVALMGDPGQRARVRACEAEPCRMLYLDRTPGGRRRWCSMRICGNNAKAARHRETSAP